MKRFLRSAYHFIAYNLYFRFAFQKTLRTHIKGFHLTIEPSVLHPKFFKSGDVFAEFLATIDMRGKKVLDMGTGSGILALVAASQGATVTAVDKSSAAARCARENFLENGFDSQVKVVEGDLFVPVGQEQFDVILFNPPYLAHRPMQLHELALFGGEHLSVVQQFATSASAHLRGKGHILLILSSDAPIDQCLNIFHVNGFSVNVLQRKKMFFEEFTIYKFTPLLQRQTASKLRA